MKREFYKGAGGKLCIIVALFAMTMTSNAYNLSWNNKYTHFSKEEPLKDILKAIASEQNTPVVISDQVLGTVSAYYRDESTQKILSDLKNTYSLMTFFDGDTLYIYKINEVEHSSITMQKNPITALEYELIEKNILDKNNKGIRWELDRGTNSVSFNGPRRFVEIVLETANRLDQSNSSVNIYKWKSADGTVNYSNEPPFNSKYKRVKTIRRYKTVPQTKSDKNMEVKK